MVVPLRGMGSGWVREACAAKGPRGSLADTYSKHGQMRQPLESAMGPLLSRERPSSTSAISLPGPGSSQAWRPHGSPAGWPRSQRALFPDCPQVVGRLERRGWVRRNPDPTNGRRRHHRPSAPARHRNAGPTAPREVAAPRRGNGGETATPGRAGRAPRGSVVPGPHRIPRGGEQVRRRFSDFTPEIDDHLLEPEAEFEGSSLGRSWRQTI